MTTTIFATCSYRKSLHIMPFDCSLMGKCLETRFQMPPAEPAQGKPSRFTIDVQLKFSLLSSMYRLLPHQVTGVSRTLRCTTKMLINLLKRAMSMNLKVHNYSAMQVKLRSRLK